MRAIIVTFLISLLLISCNSKPSLEQYFVENTENKNFIQVDLSPSILNIDAKKLSLEQSSALKSFNKMNILAFKLDGKNNALFQTERAKVNEILKDGKYQQLIKFGSGKEGASISYVGEDEHISEFILYGNKKDAGFGIVRILGKDMNPSNLMTMVGALQNANINLDQLKPLLDQMGTNKKE
jgi:hypothetical protein